jgi:hypothetical protein
MSAQTSVRTNAARKNAVTPPERFGEKLTTPITRAAAVEARNAKDACQNQAVGDVACHSSKNTAETMQTCIAARSVFLKHAMQAITPGTQPTSGRLYGIALGRTLLRQAQGSSSLLRLATNR